jgi:biotin transport system substrate-specific component
MLMYLLEGSMGLPFFSGGASGVAHLVGPTGGYLVGFVVAAAIIGGLAERGWDRGPLRASFAMLLGSAALFGCGLAQLAMYVPPGHLLEAGLTPFLLGSLVKVAAASLLLPGLWRVLERSGLSPRSR